MRRLFPTFRAASLRTLSGPALIALAAALVWIPYWTNGLSCGHDFDFHLVSWVEIAQGWHKGLLYPHWAQTPNWGAGEPRFVFYPPLSWLLGSGLGLLVGWQAATTTLIWIMLMGTGLAVRALARQWFADFTATLAGLIAMFSGYTLFTAFERSAFGELAGGISIPLVLLFALRQRRDCDDGLAGRAEATAVLVPSRAATTCPPATSGEHSVRLRGRAATVVHRAFDGSCVPLGLVVAVCWLSNAPTGVMACYLLAFVALVTALAERALWPILRAAVAVPLGLGAAACYLIPAAVEQRWIDVAQATSAGMRIADSWLFARHAAPDLQPHDEVLHTASWLVVVLVGLSMAGFVVAYQRGRLRGLSRGALACFAALPVAVLVLQFPISAWVWTTLPKLTFLQFPWRLLLLMEAPMALLVAAACSCQRRGARILVGSAWALILLASLLGSRHWFYQSCDADDSIASQLAGITSGFGMVGTDEYAPPGGDNSLVATDLPDACLVQDANAQLGDSTAGNTPTWDPAQGSCDETFTADVWQPDHKKISALTDDDGFLILRLRSYPAWRVMVNGKIIPRLAYRDDGLVAIPVDQGPNEVNVDWIRTPDVLLGQRLTAVSILLLGLLFVFERRLQRLG